MKDIAYYTYYSTVSSINILRRLYRNRQDMQATLSDLTGNLEKIMLEIDTLTKDQSSDETKCLMIQYNRLFYVIQVINIMIMINRKKLEKTTLFIY